MTASLPACEWDAREVTPSVSSARLRLRALVAMGTVRRGSPGSSVAALDE